MKISILGCGWLGFPLAKKLAEQGYVVKGSTTQREKMPKMSDAGIIPFQIKLFAEGVQGDLNSFLADAEVLIIDIPPGLKKDPEANFTGKMGRLKKYVETARVKNVLFISSTSVYEDGEDFPVYFENDPANASSERSKQIISAEKLFLSSEEFNITVLRFGGLNGPGRHPVNSLSGRKEIKDPEAPVNLIHLEDCIEIISEIIEQKAWGEIFNAVHPDHPEKAHYYTRLAEEKNLALPEFKLDSRSKGKIVHSVHLNKILGYSFKDPI